ncbi:hypothetical protein M404DRAFT_375203 [Pisolithus tinctorius Marx 270]|uniref:Uncharacterized protein n=1 Tax=Pisolithus tinctorius Marx 270 TaxID=870435 RepID=A0A0C3KE69_PISTI|nr:hypothetical protein M404DRAFT_375203 [Pisolithus tinctorius Marx 270]
MLVRPVGVETFASSGVIVILGSRHEYLTFASPENLPQGLIRSMISQILEHRFTGSILCPISITLFPPTRYPWKLPCCILLHTLRMNRHSGTPTKASPTSVTPMNTTASFESSFP